MATQWYQVVLRQIIGGIKMENVFDYRVEDPSQANWTAELAGNFRSLTMLDVNNIQHEDVLNDEVYCINRSDSKYTHLANATGTGDVIAASGLLQLPTQMYYFRLNVGDTFAFIDGAEETVRPIRRGAKYISGLVDEAVAAMTQNDVYLLTERLALADRFATTITVGGTDDMIPIVHGWALPVKTPLPGRAEVYADIVGASSVGVSNLKSRAR